MIFEATTLVKVLKPTYEQRLESVKLWICEIPGLVGPQTLMFHKE